MADVSKGYVEALRRYYRAQAEAPKADVRERPGDPEGDPMTDTEMEALQRLVVASGDLGSAREKWRNAGMPRLVWTD